MPFDAAPQKPEPSVPQCGLGVGLTAGVVMVGVALLAFSVAVLWVRWWFW
jgi:hypothetical protein